MKFALFFGIAAAQLDADAACKTDATEAADKCKAELTCGTTTKDDVTTDPACIKVALCTTPPDDKTTVACPQEKKDDTKSGSTMLQLSAVAAATALYTLY